MRLKPSPLGHSVMMSRGARKHSWFPSPVSDCSLCLHRFSPAGLPRCLTKPSMPHFHEMLTFLLGLLTLPSTSTQHHFITVIPMLWVREILPVILRSSGALPPKPPSYPQRQENVSTMMKCTVWALSVLPSKQKGLRTLLHPFWWWDAMVLWDWSKAMGFKLEIYELAPRLHP